MVNRRQLLKISALGTASFAAPLAYSASNITMAYNTGNAIGSTSPKDLSDNARNLDHLVNGTDASYLDRKGVPRKSWKGMEGEHNSDQVRRESEFDADQAERITEFDADQDNREVQFSTFMDASGYEPPIPYESGILLDRTTKTVSYLGNEYRAKSAYIPFTSSNWAVDAGKLKLIGDDSLRQELANPTNTLDGYQRSVLAGKIATKRQMLDALSVSLWEFANMAIQVNPADWRTWDWSASLIAASALDLPVVGHGLTYKVSKTVVSHTINLSEMYFEPMPSVNGGILLEFSGDDSVLNIEVDALGKGISCVRVSGHRSKGRIGANNITGQPTVIGGPQSGVTIDGFDCRIGVYGANHQKGTSENDSIPRLLSTDGGGNNNTITSLTGTNLNCGWVSSQPQCYFETIDIDGLADNGIYHLAGKIDGNVATFMHGLDEMVVGGGKTNINVLRVKDCKGNSSLGNGNLTVGRYEVSASAPEYAYVPIRTRTGNVSSTIEIGKLVGNIYLVAAANGAGIIQAIAGEITDTSIGEIDLKLHYVAGSTKLLAQNDYGKGYNIGRIKLELIDETGTLTGADKFDFRLPGAITKPSFLGETTLISTSGELRVSNFSQPLARIADGQEINATAGPYLVPQNASFPKPRSFVINSVPTLGTHVRGDKLVLKNISIGYPVEYRVVTGGSPGSARATAWIVNRGSTAGRPTLSANDVGVLYFDVNLSANGKPIWWTGLTWVDALGAAV